MRFLTISLTLWLSISRAQGKILFRSYRDGNAEIYLMRSNGEGQTQLTHNGASDFSPSWFPNGQQIVFCREQDGNPEIYVMDADGDNVRQVTQLEFAVAPKWSPDRERIAFEGIINQRRQVYVISADGTNRQLVSQPIPNAEIFLGGWSPDGTRILYKTSINDSVKNSIVIITTLRTKKHEPVPIPKMDSTSVN